MGTLRIHFTAEDVSRTRLALSPDPLWEIVCSLHRLQTWPKHPSRPGYAGWHQRIRRDAQRHNLAEMIRSRLLPLVPLGGYFPDFLTPGPVTSVDAGLDLIRGTGKPRVRDELNRLGSSAGAEVWLSDLAAGRAGALDDLGTALRRYFDIAVAPYWPQISAAVSGDRALRGARILGGGIGQILEDLGPSARWTPPVLSIHGYPADRSIPLNGRGIVLIPAYFCWHTPIALADPELPPILVYPARRQPATAPTTPTRDLGPLIGHTRLAVLHATSGGATTGELARRIGISPGTASHHASVLREGGLISSSRHGNLMVHRLTSLGSALLDGTGQDPAP